MGDVQTQRLPVAPCASPKKGLPEPGSEEVQPIVHYLNADLDLGFGSAISLNFDPNLGPVQVGSGSNLGSELNIGITRAARRTANGIRPYDDGQDTVTGSP